MLIGTTSDGICTNKHNNRAAERFLYKTLFKQRANQLIWANK